MMQSQDGTKFSNVKVQPKVVSKNEMSDLVSPQDLSGIARKHSSYRY
jgi:hypothetical protein